MDLERISEIADELEGLAKKEEASFGLYREAHEEDVFARATTHGVVLFVVELLNGITRIKNPVGHSLIPLNEDADFHDPEADLAFHAIELYGDDLPVPNRRKLRIRPVEYAAIMGCLLTIILFTIFSLFGAFFVGRWLWYYFT